MSRGDNRAGPYLWEFRGDPYRYFNIQSVICMRLSILGLCIAIPLSACMQQSDANREYETSSDSVSGGVQGSNQPSGMQGTTNAGSSLSSASWLDNQDMNDLGWNNHSVGTPLKIPAAPRSEDPDTFKKRCKNSQIDPKSQQERSVNLAGWTIVAPSQTSNGVTIVTGASDADGMCRPWNYQIFVFSRDRFAGTISPYPMSSRQDGSAWGVSVGIPRGDTTILTANFNRYTDEDPLCCPSSTTVVRYRLLDEDRETRLTPVDFRTEATAADTSSS